MNNGTMDNNVCNARVRTQRNAHNTHTHTNRSLTKSLFILLFRRENNGPSQSDHRAYIGHCYELKLVC